jgi:hypothetical protein
MPHAPAPTKKGETRMKSYGIGKDGEYQHHEPEKLSMYWEVLLLFPAWSVFLAVAVIGVAIYALLARVINS